MNKKVLTAVGSIALLFATQFAYAEDSDSERGQGGGRQGPPPEAFTACEGKSVGDSSEFEGRNGEAITGTCEEGRDGELILRPDNPPERR